ATSPRLPVGRVFAGGTLTIVDAEGSPVADGEIGEFVVTSGDMALGYWGDPEATARAFTVDPADPDLRIFKTGDLGRRRPEGVLDFIGRKDAQIKLRGHRIELEEIERALAASEGVAAAAVVVRRTETGAPRSLAAYVTAPPGRPALEPSDLTATLASQLPGYMVPPTIIVVDQLPRLPNLKIDRVRLTRMDAERVAQLAKQSDDAGVGEGVLGVTDAAIDDNVASLGGDSLQALRVAADLEKRFGIPIPPRIFQRSETIGALAQWIGSQRSGTARAPKA